MQSQQSMCQEGKEGMRRCPKCNSIWVCWNWFHCPDLQKEIEMNPHLPPEELGKWGHECWNCGDEYGGTCFETPHKVRDGIPYKILRFVKG